MPGDTNEEISRRRARWLSRRGLLELDIILSRFLDSPEFAGLTAAELKLYTQLLSWQDHDFLNALENRDISTDKKLAALIKKIQSGYRPSV